MTRGQARGRRHPFPALVDLAPAGHLANPSKGYVRLPRELLDPDHPLSPKLTGDPASKREAIVDLVAMAAWDKREDRDHGEVLAGTRWLADRWRWSRTRVRRFLEELEATGTISWVRGTRKGEPSRIMIIGYARLQRGQKSGPGVNPPRRPTSPAHPSSFSGAANRDSSTHLPRPRSWAGRETPTNQEDTADSHGEAGSIRAVPAKTVQKKKGRPLAVSASPDRDALDEDDRDYLRGDAIGRQGVGGEPMSGAMRREREPGQEAMEAPHNVATSCADCGALAEPNPAFAVNRCTRCALAAGKAERVQTTREKLGLEVER